jgi:hypothetical protein
MNPTVIAVLAKNQPDIEAIINKIGIANLLALMPHVMAILATVEAAQTAQPAAPVHPYQAPAGR